MTGAPGQDKLKTAIFGYGKMGQHHKTAIGLSGLAELAAVSDPMAGDDLRESLGREAIAFYSRPEQLLAGQKPDVVHICTPAGTHAELALLALDAGCHIYVEKPFAATVGQAEEILAKAGDKSLKVCAGHQVMFEDMARRLPSMIAPVGNIVHVESYFSFRQVRRNLTPVEQAIDILPHPVYMLAEFINTWPRTEDLVVYDPFADATGEVRCMVKRGSVTGMLNVTLRGRPVESYLKIIGDNGTILADFVRNVAIQLPGPGASAFDAIINPYWYSKQLACGTTKAFLKRALKKQRSYPGLAELIGEFYKAIFYGLPSPVAPASIIETVDICERIGEKLLAAHAESERAAEQRMKNSRLKGAGVDTDGKTVLVTGGTGFLGKKVVDQLSENHHRVRVVSRALPLHTLRIPGVEYMQCDLAGEIAPELLQGVDLVIHCAAETSGGQQEHLRNSINATRNLIKASHKAGILKFVFISSIAVLKSSRQAGAPLEESSPVDYGNISRGPYVWGKAEAEKLCGELSNSLGMHVKIIRPGPLVDFGNFNPPGRLGRKIGPFFFAVGSRKSRLAVCDVTNAAGIISRYADSFDRLPEVLNLLDPEVPTRSQLVKRLTRQNPYLKVIWIPSIIVNILSPVLVVLQKLVMGKKQAIRVAEAFASEAYDTSLAGRVYGKPAESRSATSRKSIPSGL